jgi:hypothetical protein
MKIRQPWISVYSVTEREIDIIRSLKIQQECINSLIPSRGKKKFQRESSRSLFVQRNG